MWVGYTSMVISLSLIFFGVKTYRDSYASGIVSFGKAFKIGILITVVASVIYALSWEVAYHTVSKGFVQKMEEHYTQKLKEETKGEAELSREIEEMEQYWIMYKNPVIRFGMSVFEIFPVGLVISLLSAGLLRKKEFLSATSTIIVMLTLLSCTHSNSIKMEASDNLKLGAFSVSLTVKDIHASKEFYEKLGFKILGGDIGQNYLIMKNENSIIGLFQGMFEKNILTFNPGWDENGKDIKSFTDVRQIQRQLKGKGLKFESEADENTSGPASFMLMDPDGNPVLFDQHR
jgi:lactoylglutathione lyase